MSVHDTPEVRNLRFNLDGVPRYWHGGQRAATLFLNNLSIFFPAGERFFVASVKAHKEHVKDGALAEAVRAFSAQESFHGREHNRYNHMLRAQGYPIDAMEKRVERLIARLTKRTPKSFHLAATAALEHFTALMADMLLCDERALEGAHPELAALWRWHAAEENEHKAVAFDVYRAAGYGYATRVFVMGVVSAIFWGKVTEHQVRLMRHDGLLWSLEEWMALGHSLFVEPGMLRKLVRPYLEYLRPDFHPWQLDNRAMLDAWKNAHEGSEVGRRASQAAA